MYGKDAETAITQCNATWGSTELGFIKSKSFKIPSKLLKSSKP
jgi:hypothetical protein